MEGAMRELARGDANESQAPRGCRRHLTAGAPRGDRGTEQQQVAYEHASYLFWPESRAARADVSSFFLPLEVIHCGEIYLWSGGQHYQPA